MRFIHTADWHLGRSLKRFNLIEDQAHALEQLLKVSKEAKPDLIVVAGDVYDRSMPSSEAVSLLDQTLTQFVKGLRIPVLLIAGNHDSPDRVGYGGRIFSGEKLYVFGSLTPEPEPVVFSDKHGDVQVFGIPYAGPLVAKEKLGVDDISDHEGVLRECTRRCVAKIPTRGRAVLVAHAFVTGGQTSDSERCLTVGGTGETRSDALDGFSYVALGHLHRPQALKGGRLHYAGSLLKYSASEAKHKKSVKLVEIDGRGKCVVEEIAIKPKRDLRRLTGTLGELLKSGLRDLCRDDYIIAELTDEGPPLNPMQRLQDVYPNTVEIVRPGQTDGEGTSQPDDLIQDSAHEQLSVPDLFAQFFQYATEEDLPSRHRREFERVLTRMNERGGDEG